MHVPNWNFRNDVKQTPLNWKPQDKINYFDVTQSILLNIRVICFGLKTISCLSVTQVNEWTKSMIIEGCSEIIATFTITSLEI